MFQSAFDRGQLAENSAKLDEISAKLKAKRHDLGGIDQALAVGAEKPIVLLERPRYLSDLSSNVGQTKAARIGAGIPKGLTRLSSETCVSGRDGIHDPSAVPADAPFTSCIDQPQLRQQHLMPVS